METISVEKQSENAIKWIEALLSGKYKQQKYGFLGDEVVGYCCWGVGCFVTKQDYNSEDGWFSRFNKHVGFKSAKGNIDPEFYNERNLAAINDRTNAGFKRIGKYLIKHAETNFNKEVAENIKNHFNGN